MPEQVRIGMYVKRLGGSFFRHPFWRKRFYLTSQADVDILRKCNIPYVEIDEELGCGPIEEAVPAAEPESYLVDQIGENVRRHKVSIPYRPITAASARSAAQRRAHRTVSQAKVVVGKLFDAARLGKAVPVKEALELVEEIDSMFESGEHMLLDVVRMKTADEYTHLHSVAVCALMLKLARHLGMPDDEARECGLAGLLHDVGKMRIPPEILHKPGRLTDDETTLVKTHSEQGYQILQDVAALPQVAMDVVRLHHEKMDGTGYPLALAGDDIPIAARMGAICDVYDALTSNRAYKEAWSPLKALSKMRSFNGHFDEDLLEAFAQSINLPGPSLNGENTARLELEQNGCAEPA